MSKPWTDPRTQALFQAGFLHKVDFILAGTVLVTLVTAIFWLIFGHPSSFQMGVCGFIVLFALGVWLVTLSFRASYWALQTLAKMNTLPADAGKMALLFQAQVAGTASEE